MGEAILVKAGGLGGNGGSDPEDQNIVDWQLKTELITESKEFIVPKAKNQQFSVRLFGAGGTHPVLKGMGWTKYAYIPGASGNMNNGQFKLNRGDTIPIVIGDGGNISTIKAGGTTSFGTYLSATGGGIADYVNNNGADGGVGSPAYIEINGSTAVYASNESHSYYSDFNIYSKTNAGKSYYGGGSGGCGFKGTSVSCYLKGANGGIYGGGGGSANGQATTIGGTNCGNGGNDKTNASNGINTLSTILNEFNGYGSGRGKYGGGGGYGGSGFNSYSVTGSNVFSNSSTFLISCGGGGGIGDCNYLSYPYQPYYIPHTSYSIQNMIMSIVGGYGGGYGNCLGGYGKTGYGRGALSAEFNRISNYSIPMNGICILTYYAPVYNNG